MAKAFTISSGLNAWPAEGRAGALAAATLVTVTAASAQPVAPQPLLSTTLQGGDGDDVLVASQAAVTETLFGNDGNDTLFGQDRDRLYGGSGADLLYGGGENGGGLYGGAGDDAIIAEGGLASGPTLGFPGVRVEGGDGNDTILNWNGGVNAYGGAGDDRFEVPPDSGDFPAISAGYEMSFHGGDGDDVVRVNPHETLSWHGSAYIYGDSGNDDIAIDSTWGHLAFGGAGNDRIFVREGELVGDAGDDQLFGGDGRNNLYGGAGTDSLFGGAGQDRLSGGQGGDLLYGGAGADVFVADASTDRTGRADRVMDLDVAAGDRINLTQLLGNMSGVDLIAEGFVRATAVTIDGTSYAAIEVDRDGAAGKGAFQQALLVRTDDPLALNDQEFWTFG